MFDIIEELIYIFSGKSYKGKKRLRNGDYLYNSKDDHFIDESICLIDEIQFGFKHYHPISNRKRLIKRRRI